MEAILERCCGLDVHRDTVVACVLIGPLDQKPETTIRTFVTTANGLHELRDWLTEHECHHVAMESTGVYWKPVFEVLETLVENVSQILVVNARHMKNVPGRKTDIHDAEWIAQLLRSGLLKGSFIPPQPIREMRDISRYRKSIAQQAASQKNRIEKFLQSCGIKLSSVLSDIFGDSGRALLDRWTAEGYVDDTALRVCLKGRLRAKASQVSEVTDIRLSDHQRRFLRLQVDHLHRLEQNLAEAEALLKMYYDKYQVDIHLVDTIPGIDWLTATSIVAEIGHDLTTFATSSHLASWAGLSPGNNESAGKKKSARVMKGNPYVKRLLCEIAWVVTRMRQTSLSQWFWKVRQRRGAKKAIVALARKLLTIIYHVLKDRQPYDNSKACLSSETHMHKRHQKMIRELKNAGYEIQPVPQAAR